MTCLCGNLQRTVSASLATDRPSRKLRFRLDAGVDDIDLVENLCLNLPHSGGTAFFAGNRQSACDELGMTVSYWADDDDARGPWCGRRAGWWLSLRTQFRAGRCRRRVLACPSSSWTRGRVDCRPGAGEVGVHGVGAGSDRADWGRITRPLSPSRHAAGLCAKASCVPTCRSKGPDETPCS